MFKNIFQKAGLTPTQAEILDYLYEKEEDKASSIAKNIKKSRAIVYKDLDEMVKLLVVERIDRANQASVFKIGHPTNMEKFFDGQEDKIKKDRLLFNNYLPDMVSIYNLMSNKPGVKFYEGDEGIIKALEYMASRLKPDTEIVSFVKVLPERYLLKINEALGNFVKKRIKKNVKTRVIAFDTPEGEKLKADDNKNLRRTKLVNKKNLQFDFPGGEMFIYEDEVCSISIENGSFFAFIVQNKNIAYMFKAFFESTWSLLPPSDSV